MTPAEFRILRERLGLTTNWLADYYGVGHRTVTRWDRGEKTPGPRGKVVVLQSIPPERAAALRELEQRTDQVIDGIARELRTQASAKEGLPTVQTYVTDEQYQEHEAGPWTSAWHRAVVGRAVEAYGRPAIIRYATDRDASVDN
jgi:transcriptional regulator with XRE-family HTH domain